ncbi:MAG: glycoside hydrolase family 2 TIM barrel-domain containing protein, partial [Eubacteriales bacterium]|nr:glycoside hydrolase family 2 TIM barrel-domain containing protein [Eubacteriales bacterium]
MKRINIDRGWNFFAGKKKWPAKEEPVTKIVDLPHDFTIETDPYPEAPSGASSGYYNGGFGNYSKLLEIPQEWAGKKILVEFDGVYKDATVSFGENVAALHPYGYTPFHADITPYATPGAARELCVTVNNTAQPNSRWYSGSGIYRHVDLLVGGPVHIAPWGIFAYTERVQDGTAYVMVEITVHNETAQAENLRVRAEMGGACAARALHVPANEKATARIRLIVPEVKLWDIDSPNLYDVKAVLENMDGEELDTEETLFGVRTISVDVQNGFMLNGRTVKLKGGCVHHDNGMLGAASFYDSEYRKFSLMKQGGFNAIRCAHNPPSRDMLKVCDELGLLVMDEAFDMWTMEKTTNDYHLHFHDWWKRDMEAFITRDRNHPCVVFWSTGNEIVERGGLSDGYEWARQLADHARRLDPTRPVANALCSMWSGLSPEETAKVREEREKAAQSGGTQNMSTPYMDAIWGKYTEAFAAPLDVVGYNYLDARYAADGERYPDRVICGTESFPLDIDIIWHEVKRLPYVIG